MSSGHTKGEINGVERTAEEEKEGDRTGGDGVRKKTKKGGSERWMGLEGWMQ